MGSFGAWPNISYVKLNQVTYNLKVFETDDDWWNI